MNAISHSSVSLAPSAPLRATSTVRWLALAGIVGPVGFTLAWLVLGFISPGYTAWGVHIAPYSPISQSISGLGLGVTGAYMNAAFVLNGVLTLLAALGVSRGLPQLSRGARWTVLVALALPGLGSIMDGIFTLESFLGHTTGFALALSSIVGFPLIGRYLRGLSSWRPIGTWLLIAGPLTLGLAIAYFLTFSPTPEGALTGVAGLTERILVLEIQLWYVVLGWLTFRRTTA